MLASKATLAIREEDGRARTQVINTSACRSLCARIGLVCISICSATKSFAFPDFGCRSVFLWSQVLVG